MNYQNDFWKQYFRYYDILLKVIPYQELFESIVKHLDVKSGMTILDLGAGTGNLQYFLPNDVNVIGLDNSEEALERLSSKFPQTPIVKHSIKDRLPFEDNKFDRIVSCLLYTSPSPRDRTRSRMPSSA